MLAVAFAMDEDEILTETAGNVLGIGGKVL